MFSGALRIRRSHHEFLTPKSYLPLSLTMAPGKKKRLPATELSIKNYGCIRDVTIRLTPLHAFIGPNDSGKSTILRAMRIIVQLASECFSQFRKEWSQPFHPYLEANTRFEAGVNFDDDIGYKIGLSSPGSEKHRTVVETLFRGGVAVTDYTRQHYGALGILHTVHIEKAKNIIDSLNSRLSGARLLRFDPDALRNQSTLISEGKKPFLHDERGAGLPGVYDAILNRDVESYLHIQENLRELFPTVKKLSLRNTSESTKALEIQLASGERISADQMSEGMLLYLAYAAIPHIEPTSMLLVEEPENGLHPARIADVVRVLREVSQNTQVLIATHNPLVVNELEPEEVSIVTRPPEEGTRVTPIVETPGFEERSKVYALGELWLRMMQNFSGGGVIERKST